MTAPSDDEQREVDVNEQAEMSALGDLEDRLVGIEDSLLDELSDDARFDNSDEMTRPDDELDFIQMTGLTSPSSTPDQALPPELNPELPVKFVEDSVQDVDPRRDPFANGDDHIGQHDNPAFVPQRPPTSRPKSAPRAARKESASDEVANSLRSIAEELGTEADESQENTPVYDSAAPVDEAPLPSDLDGDIARELRNIVGELQSTDDAISEPLDQLDAPIPTQTPIITETAASQTPEAPQAPQQEEFQAPPQEAPQAEPAIPLEESESLIAALAEQAQAVEESEVENVAPEVFEPAAIAPEPVAPTPVAPTPVAPEEAPALEIEAFNPTTKPLSAPEHQDERDQTDEGARFEEEYPDAQIESPVQRRRSRTKRVRGLSTIVFILIGIGAAGAAAYGGWMGLRAYRATPQAMFDRAQSLAGEGRYAEAAERFLATQRAFPNDAIAADSLFSAALALSNMDAAPRGRQEEAYASALSHLDIFIREYPDHDKHARAITMRGGLLHKSGNHEEAIRILSDPRQRARDPEGYLSSLRVLAASFGALGRLDEAHSASLRAASLPNNYSPDRDYLFLAELYQKNARQTDNPADRLQYRELAVESWKFALRVPGLPRSEKRTVRNLIEAETALMAADAMAQPEAGTPMADFMWRPASERPELEETTSPTEN